MIIKMKKDTLGSEDGIHTMLYKADQEYEINTGLADVFIRMGVADEVKPEVKMQKVPENKMVEPERNKQEVKKKEEKKEKRRKLKDIK